MTALARLGLRARLALALVATAALAVGAATLLSNHGLPGRVNAAAHARLERQARHLAVAAATFYGEDGAWRAQHALAVEHLAATSGVRARIARVAGTPVGSGPLRGPHVTVPILFGGRTVGRLTVAPLGRSLLTPEEAHLRHSLDRLHLAAAGISGLGALALAFLLAQGLSGPLRRIRAAADRIAAGDLSARVDAHGGPELAAVGHALNRLAETLEREEELRKENVANVAHELRTPVHGLLSRIEAAQDGVLHDEAANLEAMHAEALRLTRLLDDLASLADAEQPGLLLDKRVVDLAQVARTEAELFAPRFAEASIRFSSSLEPVHVGGDASRLGQVAANLLSNALRYTEPGGEVHLRVGREGGLAFLEVADTGIGIAPEDLQHVFKRFWRGERSRSRTTGGAGIGLAIVHELVRAHDGRIEVDSRPGEGSRFRVLLSAVPPELHGTGRSASRDLQMPLRA